MRNYFGKKSSSIWNEIGVPRDVQRNNVPREISYVSSLAKVELGEVPNWSLSLGTTIARIKF
jgi:hypothetical protein